MAWWPFIDPQVQAIHKPSSKPGSLGLRLRTSAGAVHPLEAYATWTREAGCSEVRAVSLSRTAPLALLTCTNKE